jgi:NAD(P)H-dependent flavin oxidoreductase YrpB (nitropropane dioxygenase family)
MPSSRSPEIMSRSASLKTPICEQLGIELPIFGFSHSVEVTVALTKAGGFGVYGAARESAEDIARHLAKIRDMVGDLPFGVDVMLPKGMPEKTLEEIQAELPEQHIEFVEHLREKYDVPPARNQGFFNSMVRTPGFFDDQLQAALESDVNMLAFGVGFTPEAVARAKDRNMLTAALIGHPKHAQSALHADVEVIVAQGAEAGGHTGEISTLTLVPQSVAMAEGRPVLAAGGIGHGSQVAASLAMGAQGVWLGTKWLTTLEHQLEQGKVDKLLAAGSGDTVVTRGSSGKPQRQIRSAWSNEWAAPDAPKPLKMPYQHALVGDLIIAVEENDIEPLLTEPAGQSVAWCENVSTVADVVEELVEQTHEALSRMATMLS